MPNPFADSQQNAEIDAQIAPATVDRAADERFSADHGFDLRLRAVLEKILAEIRTGTQLLQRHHRHIVENTIEFVD